MPRLRSRSIALVLGMLMAVFVAACDSTSDEAGDDEPVGGKPLKVAPLGPFVGECGHVTDDEVQQAAGMPQITRVFRNSVGCHWRAGGQGSTSVTFASYRGSPIERERAWVTTQGRAPQKIEVAGKSGFAALSPEGQVCDLAVRLGDDFFEWSMSYGAYNSGSNPCDRMRDLAKFTVQRLS